jgi:hypothetical protein
MRKTVVVRLQLFRIAYSYNLFSYEDQINIITPGTLSVSLLYSTVSANLTCLYISIPIMYLSICSVGQLPLYVIRLYLSIPMQKLSFFSIYQVPAYLSCLYPYAVAISTLPLLSLYPYSYFSIVTVSYLSILSASSISLSL